MTDHETIKALAKQLGVRSTQLIALAAGNDPFYLSKARVEDAEWFGEIWSAHGGEGSHLRRIHYQLISQKTGVICCRDGRPYENTEGCWQRLIGASRDARYLGVIPPDGLVDRRNDDVIVNVYPRDPDDWEPKDYELHADDNVIEDVEVPALPFLYPSGFDEPSRPARQDYAVEIWIEKSTLNDWLVPLCKRRRINLLVGTGEQSEIRSRELAYRSDEYPVPVRVIYISDFDPAGRSMPKAMARKVEFTIDGNGLDADVQVIPFALTPAQCLTYALPRTPMKDGERRKDKFEETFGAGATELDAMEALFPGELERLLNREIDNWIDPTLERRKDDAFREAVGRLQVVEREIINTYQDQIDAIEDEVQQANDLLDAVSERQEGLWKAIAEEITDKADEEVDLDDIETPRADVPGETDSHVLYDSSRTYLEQIDYYNEWKEGTE